MEWSPSSKTLHIDERLKRLLRYPDGDMPAAEFLARILDPDDWNRLEARLTADDQDQDACEFRVSSADAEAEYFEAHIRRESDADETPTRVLCLCRDITARKRAEQARQWTQTQLHEVEELAVVGNWWWDVRSGEVIWSDQVFRIFQLDPTTFTPQIDSILALSPWPEDHERDQELIRKAIESRGRGSYEQRFLRPDGSTGYYHSTFQGLYDGDELIAMRGTVQDITERKVIELERRRNEEDLRVTLESIGDAVIATDHMGRITRMNSVAEQLTGWTLDEARGRPLPEVFHIINAHSRAPVENPVDKVLETDLVVGLANHTVLVARDGREHQIADSGAPIRSATGQTVGVVLVFRDVTDAYALEERVRQSEKMQAIGRLAGGVAHDFNNLLAAIVGSMELLQDYLPNDPEARELSSTILHGAEQAAGLTAKLLDFARNRPSSKSLVDVHVVVEDALGILRRTANPQVSIGTQLGAERSRIEGDPVQLQNAFLNLGINAAQSMPSGGTLSVTSYQTTLDEADCRDSGFSLEPGPHVVIEFTDSGEGIPPEIVGRIFEPFFTTKHSGDGTGLGMAAVWGAVQDCNGAIRVETQLGVGTRFIMTFPLSESEPEDAHEQEEALSGRGLVLVVDDDPVVRATAEASLRKCGYDVLLADGGRRAVELFGEHAERIDVVLLDMIMPGMDGKACFAALREIDPSVKVIVCSGFAREPDMEALRAQGLSGILDKPYRIHALSRAVHDAIAQEKE